MLYPQYLYPQNLKIMTDTNVVIRNAQSDDIITIMELLQLKAEFDGYPDSVEATAQKLGADLFGENPLAFVLLAAVNGNPVGFATYHFIYSTFLAKPGIWLDDLYLRSTHRGKGIGQTLIRYLCQIAKENGCGRIDWTVATTNDRGINFYEKVGAKVRREVRVCRLDSAAIEAGSRGLSGAVFSKCQFKGQSTGVGVSDQPGGGGPHRL